MENFFQNIWVITILGGAAAGILVWIFTKRVDKNTTNNQTNSQQTTTTVTNNLNIAKSFEEKNLPSRSLSSAEITLQKETAKILFIDDLDLRSKIRNLVNAGWNNVGQIKDASNIDQKEIREANIIFVDYKGIGKPSKEQGLAVMSALRERYKDTKWLILYSAHDVPINAFNKGANSYLVKNSSVYELEQKIIEGLGKILK